MSKIVILLIGLLAIPALLLAKQAETDTKTPTPNPQITSGAKTDWLANMERHLPVVLCQSNHYFIECFETTESQCVVFTSTLVKACLNNIALALPTKLDQTQGEYWGRMMGRCTFDLYEKYMQAKKKTTEQCQAQAAVQSTKNPTPSSSKDAK